MKKGKLFFTVTAMSAVLLISCKREYTCQCSGGFSGGIQPPYVIDASTRNTAEHKCEANNPPPMTPDGLYCELQ